MTEKTSHLKIVKGGTQTAPARYARNPRWPRTRRFVPAAVPSLTSVNG